MTLNILPNARTIFFDANGNPLASGSVYMYVPNSSTLKNTWQDSAAATLNSNPIILDSDGGCLLWGSGAYRQLVFDSLGNTIWDKVTVDPGYAVVTSFSGTSTTSVLIGTGTKSFTTQTGLEFFPGQFLVVSSSANATNFMVGTVTSYNISTGALVMNITTIGGSGTHADWNISISGPGSGSVNSGISSEVAYYATSGSAISGNANVTIDGSGNLTASAFVPSSATIPSYGFYLPATNILGFATNSAEVLRLDASGNVYIGTTNATTTSRLVVQKTNGDPFVVFRNSGTSSIVSLSLSNGSGALGIRNNASTFQIYDFSSNTALLTATTGGVAFLGTTTNNSAATGFVGEIVESTVLTGAAIAMTTNVDVNITSINLTPGDWDVWANCAYNIAGSTVITIISTAISQVSATRPTRPNAGAYVTWVGSSSGTAITLPVGMMRVSLAGTSTVYLVTNGIFTVSTATAYGYLGARRVR